MSRKNTQPIQPEKPEPETNPPSTPQPVDKDQSDTTSVAVGHQPHVDWKLLRESQALSRQLDRQPEPVYRILDSYQRTS